MRKYIINLPLLILFTFITVHSQELSTKEIKDLISTYKNDSRGPYYRIKWFCENGSIREARDPCPDSIGGGIQHASFKESALKLRKTNHLFLGEILADNKFEEFLDANNNFSRLKQYQISKYLASVDDGWILQKGQYYRGAIQSEDEEAWGKAFFEKLLEKDEFLIKHFYLIRQALKDIPHNGDNNLAQLIRSQSKTISEEDHSFMDIRIKIHGQPEASDINLVKNYLDKNNAKLKSGHDKELTKLIKTMQEFYKPLDFNSLSDGLNAISENNESTEKIQSFISLKDQVLSSQDYVTEISDVLEAIRLNIITIKQSKNRLKILDISNQLENKLLIEAQNWHTETLAEHLNKINILSCAVANTGLIETWEYQAISNSMNLLVLKEEVTVGELNQFANTTRSIVEWSTSMVKANYQHDVDIYTAFEPLAYGFIDDRIRSSASLSLGESVSELGAFAAKASNINNAVLSLDNQSNFRGLNPGYAFGELVVIDGNPDAINVNSNKIYVFEKPPAGLKPVAGIMTVSEGNLVSHVQLLARNLGIPNAALSDKNLEELKKYNGKKVFYAVSEKGNVILKEETDMSDTEKSLFSKQQQNKNMIAVPVDKIRLDVNKVINMHDVNARDSGKLCGPKAANLGELKHLFPEHVVNGVIIPFGVFRNHMNKNMPNENQSYWEYLNSIFLKADALSNEGATNNEIEDYQIMALAKLHKAMLDIELDDSFLEDLEGNFKSVLGASMGETPVFLRSDTNMEDLKEFTGAGLNLTLFNILEKQKIIEGIKRVWASAYTERSFKWRQKYLSNPENVFPSILIIPSVDVDYSGVMITKGINSGNDQDLTVAFSRGAGGAVDGQSAETRLISENTNILLAPARQPDYLRLPKSGGTKTHTTAFDQPILNSGNISKIRALAQDIRSSLDNKNNEESHAYDVEFGFKDDKLWLFQIRPFVENKHAKSSEYLSSITSKVDSNKIIKTSEKI